MFSLPEHYIDFKWTDPKLPLNYEVHCSFPRCCSLWKLTDFTCRWASNHNHRRLYSIWWSVGKLCQHHGSLQQRTTNHHDAHDWWPKWGCHCRHIHRLCNTFVVDNLTSNKMYNYKVMCGDVNSMQGSFKTAPSPDDAAAIKFVWAADLAGQGYGRNPDFAVNHVDGTAMKGGYIVFETM